MLRKSDRDAIRILLVDDHEIFLGGLMSQSLGGYPTWSMLVRLAQLQSRAQ